MLRDVALHGLLLFEALLLLSLLRKGSLVVAVVGRGSAHRDHIAVQPVKRRRSLREELEVLALAGLVLRLYVRDALAALVARVVFPAEAHTRQRSEGRRHGVAVLRLGTRPLLLFLLLLPLGLFDRWRRGGLLAASTARRS